VSAVPGTVALRARAWIETISCLYSCPPAWCRPSVHETCAILPESLALRSIFSLVREARGIGMAGRVARLNRPSPEMQRRLLETEACTLSLALPTGLEPVFPP
jgi:hypothetical protein